MVNWESIAKWNNVSNVLNKYGRMISLFFWSKISTAVMVPANLWFQKWPSHDVHWWWVLNVNFGELPHDKFRYISETSSHISVLVTGYRTVLSGCLYLICLCCSKVVSHKWIGFTKWIITGSGQIRRNHTSFLDQFNLMCRKI